VTKEIITIARRLSWLSPLNVEIDCDPALPPHVKLGLAVLTRADLTGAVLGDIPKIENIHQTVYAAASAPGALDMTNWHCKTAHCRAGWVTTLAGEEGAKLEAKIGTPAAAMLIYLASDPTLERVPDFYCGNSTALADMKRLAEAEAALRQPTEGA
jgi:hypothetical protein